MFRRQLPAHSSKILLELFLVARTDDERRDGGPSKKPVQRDLRDGLAGLPRHFIESVDDFVDILVGRLRSVVDHDLCLQPAVLRQRLSAANLSSQATPTQGRPHQRSYSLIERQR